jgi:hypothetical protein
MGEFKPIGDEKCFLPRVGESRLFLLMLLSNREANFSAYRNECKPAVMKEVSAVTTERMHARSASHFVRLLLCSKLDINAAERVTNSVSVRVSFGSQDQ